MKRFGARPGGAAGVAALAAALVAGYPRVELAHAAGCPTGMSNVQGRFCVDQHEASVDLLNSKGATVRRLSPFHTPEEGQRIAARSRRGVTPQAYVSMHQAEAACEAVGKRLCSDAEWVTACKGKRPTLYPYGEEHQYGRCNDNAKSPLRILHGKDDSLATFGYEAMNDPRLNQLPGTVARAGQFSRCRNSYGLYDMVGNLHEWTSNPGGVFRGGYYLDTHIHGQGCEYLTTGHSPRYHDYSIGFRCCRSLVAGATASMPAATGQLAKPQRQLKAGERIHDVESGDTLSGIAARYSVSVAAICRRNQLDESRALTIGQRLVVPRPGEAAASPAPRGPQANPGERLHEVQAGQTLGAIAARYHVSIAAVCERNEIDRRRPIRPGQRLIIPKPR